MGIKKFIKNVQATLGLEDINKEGKKKALKDLLKKLRKRQRNIIESLKGPLEKKEKKEMEEELEIISLQIKKGKKILYKLYAKK
jgi:HPt (histidine-containing phosphotransfer) domain-containing protein